MPAELSAASIIIKFWTSSVNSAVWVIICLIVVIVIQRKLGVQPPLAWGRGPDAQGARGARSARDEVKVGVYDGQFGGTRVRVGPVGVVRPRAHRGGVRDEADRVAHACTEADAGARDGLYVIVRVVVVVIIEAEDARVGGGELEVVRLGKGV